MADPETSTGTRPKITAAIYPDGVVLLNIIAVRVPNKVINFGLRIG
jgi:hypothetical protein